MATTSKHLGGISELTVLMPIRTGFIETRDTRTYATRLRMLLRTLNQIRKISVEREEARTLSDPVERLRTIKDIRWLIFDHDTRLLLAVSFDRPWQPYLRKIAEQAGAVLDVILCNCEGYDEFARDFGNQRFARWVAVHQVEPDFFYTSSPTATVDDERYLSELEALHRGAGSVSGFEREAALLRVADPSIRARALGDRDPAAAADQGLRALEALFQLRSLFPLPGPGSDSRDHLYLHELMRSILMDFRPAALNEDQRQRHARALAWYESPLGGRRRPANRRGCGLGDSDLQGDILTQYHGMTHACLLLMRITKRSVFAGWLTSLGVTAETAPPHTSLTINISFTRQGLETLGIPPGLLASFPAEFLEGMAERGALLGDVRTNHASRWRLPTLWDPTGKARNPDINTVLLETVDFVIKFQCRDESAPGPELPKRLLAAIDEHATVDGIELLAVEPLWSYRENGFVREHFGFVDGLSQPVVVDGKTRPQQGDAYPGESVPRGELLLGYPNTANDAPIRDPLLTGSSFLVLRKLHQNVGAFRQFLARQRHPDVVQSKMVGRDPDGVPATDPSLAPSNNAFTYGRPNGRIDDGSGCPLQAHIRRANPRKAVDGRPVPRVARRSFSYGPRFDIDGDADRGLMFMAYNASIAEQFEVIQRWLTGGNSTDVLSSQSDPLLRVPVASEPDCFKFPDGDDVIRVDLVERDSGPPVQFVRLEWGMYLFVPSIPALSQLAAYAQQDSFPDAGCVTEGDATIKRLRDLESPPDKPKCGQWEASTRWKQLLEEVDPGRPDSARDVWAALRAGPESAFATPYGYLVAAQQDVMAVLADQKTISVREYWQRMRLSIGEIYLGMDRDPRPLEAERTDRDRDFERAVTAGRYQRESGHRNALLAAEQPQPAFDTARAVSLQVLAKWRSLGASALDLRGYADAVVAAMSEHWFGLPDGDLMMRGGEPNSSDDVHVPFHFLAPSRYIFPPAPTEFVTHLAHKHGRALLDRSREFVERVVAGRAPGQGAGRLLRGLFPELVDHPNAEEMDLVARTLVGVMHGFLPTTLGNFISVADQWIEGRTLWRLQMELQSQPGGDLWDVASRVLEKPLISAMQQRPVPDTLHRVTTSPTHIGNTAVPAGARIVLGIGSASRELAAQGSPSTAPIFGGDYAKAAAGEGPATAHPCPGRDMAMGTLTGMFSALLEFGSWAPHDFPLILSALPTHK